MVPAGRIQCFGCNSGNGPFRKSATGAVTWKWSAAWSFSNLNYVPVGRHFTKRSLHATCWIYYWVWKHQLLKVSHLRYAACVERGAWTFPKLVLSGVKRTCKNILTASEVKNDSHAQTLCTRLYNSKKTLMRYQHLFIFLYSQKSLFCMIRNSSPFIFDLPLKWLSR